MLLIALIAGLTIITGIGDSRGFIHAANAWDDGRVVWGELAKSVLGFAVGITAYLILIRYLKAAGIAAAEVQALGWFGITIIGVAIGSGKFGQWQKLDQLVALAVIAGLGWLVFRVGS